MKANVSSCHCGAEFCYVCGRQWVGHYCTHGCPQYGRAIYDNEGYNQDGYHRDTGLNRDGLTRQQIPPDNEDLDGVETDEETDEEFEDEAPHDRELLDEELDDGEFQDEAPYNVGLREEELSDGEFERDDFVILNNILGGIGEMDAGDETDEEGFRGRLFEEGFTIQEALDAFEIIRLLGLENLDDLREFMGDPELEL